MIEEKSFYEYAKIFENFYGTSKKEVNSIIKTNDILFDIDWQGTKQLTSFKNLRLVKIFLTAYDKEELKKRLIKRNQNSKKEIKERFKSFDKDIENWKDYDYIIINENIDICFRQLENIILLNKIKKSDLFHKIR